MISGLTVTRLLLLLSIPGSMLIEPIGGQPAASHGHEQHRRSPMGFQGVRGKRSVNYDVTKINIEQGDSSQTTSKQQAVTIPETSPETIMAPTKLHTE